MIAGDVEELERAEVIEALQRFSDHSKAALSANSKNADPLRSTPKARCSICKKEGHTQQSCPTTSGNDGWVSVGHKWIHKRIRRVFGSEAIDGKW